MNQRILTRRSVIALFLILLLSALWIGCSSKVSQRKDEPGTSESQGTTAPPSKYFAKYYSFEDVLVPGELNYDSDRTLIYETPQFKAGVMYFTKWRLDVDSLIEFFIYNMGKDNWKLVNSYKGKESLITFSKPDKSCNIRITENWLGTTHVQIAVGPVGAKKM